MNKDLTAIKAGLEHIFSDADKLEVSAGTHKDQPAIFITSSAMYDYPKYTGSGGLLGLLTKVTAICGGNNMDILDQHHSSGCDTCDYGSVYEIEYVVWEDA